MRSGHSVGSSLASSPEKTRTFLVKTTLLASTAKLSTVSRASVACKINWIRLFAARKYRIWIALTGALVRESSARSSSTSASTPDVS